MFTDKTIVVTGGTGSFGQFIVDHLLKNNAKEIRILSRDEKKQWEMKLRWPDERLRFMLCDIRNKDRVSECVYGSHVIFQAAALKQVPNCEANPMDAIQTNVLGVQNVIDAALTHRVQRMISISTDKAVKPVNVMGMTKALQERLVIQANRSPKNEGTVFACVRYGNVLGSRGSVVPLFRKLLSEGKKIRITDKRMTRFLLTLGDAVDLVVYAYENMRGGEIFVKKALAAKLVTIARVVAQQEGVCYDDNHEFIGLWSGEKLHEILITEEEVPRTEIAIEDGFFVINPPWYKYGFYVDKEYSSGDDNNQMGFDATRTLIQRSDLEFYERGIHL